MSFTFKVDQAGLFIHLLTEQNQQHFLLFCRHFPASYQPLANASYSQRALIISGHNFCHKIFDVLQVYRYSAAFFFVAKIAQWRLMVSL